MRGYRMLFLGGLICATLWSALSVAQSDDDLQTESAQATAGYSQAELDQLLGPIALYPDALLSQVLIASTYPLEIVNAQRWRQQSPGLSGSVLDSALATESWDASVKAIAVFPSIVAMMNDNLDWTQKLGNAFLAQEADVMDTVQKLRQQAQSAGTLSSNERQQITLQEGEIEIEPTDPDVVYVPIYDPTIVYGFWPWLGYPPLIWVPPPLYGPVGYITTGFGFGVGIAVGHAHFHNPHPDWHRHRIVVRPARPPGSNPPGNPVVWHHDPAHRIGVPYATNSVRDRYVPTNPGAVIQRHEFRGYRPGGTPPRPAPPVGVVPPPRAASPLAPEPRGNAQGYSIRGHASLSAQPVPAPQPVGPASAPPARDAQAPVQGERRR